MISIRYDLLTIGCMQGNKNVIEGKGVFKEYSKENLRSETRQDLKCFLWMKLRVIIK